VTDNRFDSDHLTMSDGDIEQAAREFVNSFRNELTFMNRYNRDAVYKAVTRYNPFCTVRRTSTPNQSVDPRYTFEGSDLPDKGMENDRMWFNLYQIEKRP
jgi:hypothetical protein